MAAPKLPLAIKPASATDAVPPGTVGPNAEAPAGPQDLLLAHISHGFRTPLNAIIGFSEIMEREMFGKIGIPRYIEYVNDIRSSAQHLLRLIEDVVDLAKAQSASLEMEESDIDVSAAIRSVRLMLREKVGQAGLQLLQDVPADLPRLRGDRRRLRQILQNLLSNAIHLTSRGGTITVGAALERGCIVFTVADTGKGIDAAELPRVFDPFAGLGRLQEIGGGGSGLGLPLCKGLMELHGGAIELSSQPGKGTTVILSFPAERTIKAAPSR